jgi:hypothetical protein
MHLLSFLPRQQSITFVKKSKANNDFVRKSVFVYLIAYKKPKARPTPASWCYCQVMYPVARYLGWLDPVTKDFAGVDPRSSSFPNWPQSHLAFFYSAQHLALV